MSNNDNFTKNDFKDGDVVTLRNGARLIFIDGDFFDCQDNVDNDLARPGNLTSDLKLDEEVYQIGYNYTNEISDNDIMKVERPTQYKIMYKRKEEVKEMTLAQVCEELGYNVKIIKEE